MKSHQDQAYACTTCGTFDAGREMRDGICASCYDESQADRIAELAARKDVWVAIAKVKDQLILNERARIAELTAQVEQLTAERDQHERNVRMLEHNLRAVERRAKRAEAVIEQVRAMHQPTAANTCAKCHHVWPCGTVRILDDTEGEQ